MAIGAGLASAAAEISAALTRTSQQVVSAARAAAPLLRPLRILWQQTNRNPGFHALPQPPSATRWPRARVTHYVDDRSRLLYAGFLNPTLLETVDLPTLVNGFDPPGPLRRANLGRSSVIFELEALRRVRESHQRNDPSLIDEACRCLILGIRHDLKYKSERSVPVPPPARAIGLRRPSRTPGARLPRPSLRLFDLLARLSVLHDRPEHMKTLEQLVEQVGVLTDKERRLAPVRRRGVDALASRLEQWKRPDSLWSQTVRANRTWRVVRPMEEASADGQPARRYATWNDEYQL
jgi:hypothetical protein